MSAGQPYETAADAPAMPQLRLTEDASTEMINWPNFGYADEYAKSFAKAGGLGLADHVYRTLMDQQTARTN